MRTWPSRSRPGSDGGTHVGLDAEGLLPDRGYAAHAHVRPCGATAADAGPHFQDEADPAAGPDKPSTDPAHANPENEVWLDLHTDGEMTMTDAGHAGTAGGRAACLTRPTS